MLDQAQLNTIRNYLEQARTITLVIGADSNVDVLAAAATFFDAFKAEGKEVVVASPRAITSEVVSGLTDVATEIGNQNLVVSFPYDETAVDKVSYHIGEETNQFFLTIKPKKGHEPLQADEVSFAYAGVETDLVVLLGVSSLESLEQLYFGYEDLYKKTPKISFTQSGSHIGDINISATGYSSLSECVLVLLNSLNIDFSVESATNLLSAIDLETEYMRSLKATAVTFEAVAQLLRMGARRVRPQQQQKEQVQRHTKKEAVQRGREIEVPLSTGTATSGTAPSKKHQLSKKKKKKLPSKKKNQPGGLNYDPSKNISTS